MIEPDAGTMRSVTSRDNPHFKALKKAATHNNAYRQTGWVWLEGDHLCRAAVARSAQVLEWVISDDYLHIASESKHFDAINLVVKKHGATVLPKPLMGQLCTQDLGAVVACRVAWPAAPAIQPTARSLVLDRVQDSGNVGAMLRSAAAFGYTQVLAVQGTAALWSPKVLRAAMGAHFGLHLHEGLSEADIVALAPFTTLAATSSHAGRALHTTHLPPAHVWLMGNEGSGISPNLQRAASLHVKIAQPGGEESLNVAAAAAICMHHGAIDRA